MADRHFDSGFDAGMLEEHTTVFARDYLLSAVSTAAAAMASKGDVSAYDRACHVLPLLLTPTNGPDPSPAPRAQKEQPMSNGYHHPNERTYYAATMSEYGEIVVQPFQKRQHECIGADGRTLRLSQQALCDSAEEALSRVRVSVGLAKLVLARPETSGPQDHHALVASWRTEALSQLRAELRPRVLQELRTEHAPKGFAYSELARTYVPSSSLYLASHFPLTDPKDNPTMTTTPGSASLAPPADGFAKAAALASKTFDTVKSDGRAAAMRSVCRQLVGLAQHAVVATLKEKKVAAPTRNGIAQFIKTDTGLAVMGGTMGAMMPMVPKLASSALAMEVARELRIEAGSRGLDLILDAATKRFLPDIFSAMSSLEAFGITDKE